MQIIKRNGDIVKFDKRKIVNAINKAFLEVTAHTSPTAERIANKIEQNFLESEEEITVEKVQDMVETYLMIEDEYEVAKAYIRYRYKEEVARNLKSDFFDAIGEKLAASNVQNQNANVDEHSFGGRIGEAASVMTRQYALDNLISQKAKNHHLNNEIYIHDLDAYAVGMHNCLSIPFDDLLKKGFNTRQIDVRPANSINTAFQLVAVIFQLQSLQQFGGVSATHLDWTMVPYVRKSFYKHYKDGLKYLEGQEIDYCFHPNLSIEDENYKAYSLKVYNYAMDMTIKEIHQAVEGMYHNLK